MSLVVLGTNDIVIQNAHPECCLCYRVLGFSPPLVSVLSSVKCENIACIVGSLTVKIKDVYKMHTAYDNVSV